MAVDPKYVEDVKNEADYTDILNELGIEGHFEQDGNGIDLEGYTQTTLREMYPEDICTGKPILSEIYKREFTNKNTGKTTIQWKIDLVLLDDTYEDEKEAYIFQINLNEQNIDFDKAIVKDVNSASGLYALAMGLAELKAKGISKTLNYLDVVGINALRKQVSQYKSLTVKVVEKSFKRGAEERYYNSFRITEGE